MPRPQSSGRTESGPKKPTLPQHVVNTEPTSAPSCSAAKAPAGAVAKRLRDEIGVAREARGSGRPRKVPNARRKMRSASGRSAAPKRRAPRSPRRDSCGGRARHVKPRRLQPSAAALIGSTHGAAGRRVVDRAGVPGGRASARDLAARRRGVAAARVRRARSSSSTTARTTPTAAVAERFASPVPLRVIRLPRNRGKGAAVAAGIAAARHPLRRLHRRRLPVRPRAPAADAGGARDAASPTSRSAPASSPSRRSTAATARSGCSPGGRSRC